jgi:uncharacterized caspase-like protein
MFKAKRPIDKALVIGVGNAMEGPDGRSIDLGGVGNDVSSIQHLLLREGLLEAFREHDGNPTAEDFFKSVYKHSKVELDSLQDLDATANVIKEQLANAVLFLKPNETLFVYYSGHGAQVKVMGLDGNFSHYAECWVAADGLYMGGLVADFEIKEILTQNLDPEARVIFWIDSCHSGGMARGFTKTRGLAVTREISVREYPSSSKEVMLQNDKELPNVAFFNACLPDELAYELPYKKDDGTSKIHGAFTKNSLASLRKFIDGDQSDLQKLFDEVKAKVASEPNKQTPNLVMANQEAYLEYFA